MGVVSAAAVAIGLLVLEHVFVEIFLTLGTLDVGRSEKKAIGAVMIPNEVKNITGLFFLLARIIAEDENTHAHFSSNILGLKIDMHGQFFH